MEVNDEQPLDEWRDLMLSPKGLFTGSIAEPNYFAKSVPEISSCVESTVWTNDFANGDVPMFNSAIKIENDEDVDSYTIKPSGSNGGTNAERRNGLDAWEIQCNNNDSNNTSCDQSFRSSSPIPSPADDQSPCLSIPPGINPTVLPDSPVMLSNSQLSPTTGTLASPTRDKPMFNSESLSLDKDEEDDDRSSLGFKAPANVDPLSYYSTLHSQAPYPTNLSADNQNHDAIGRSMDFKSPLNSNEKLDNTTMHDNDAPFQQTRFYGIANEDRREYNESTLAVQARPVEENYKGSYPSIGASKNAEDGYNWRKYGQKQVKGSEFPRSYYKCTYANCLVKKKVERSHDGEITEIIYKGAHSHPKPQPSRRSGPSAVSCVGSNENGEGNGDGCSSVWGDIQNVYNKDTRLGAEGLEMTSCTSVVTELSDPYSSNKGKAVRMLDSAETPELSSTLASHDEEEEDDEAEGSLSVGDDEDVESEAKRRKKEVPVMDTASGSRAVREPRVVIQIESPIDILDDGYRWRKYGQKVVKGNPNPRSYYKCTSAGCAVRKHVERASHDLKCVITTYEGKHNHEVPVARNSSHANSAGTGNLAPPLSNSQSSSLALPRNPHPKSEPQDFIPPFEQKMKYNGDYLGSNYLGSFTGGGSPPFCSLKFPSLPNSMIYGPFGLNPNNHCDSAPAPLLPSVGNLPMSLPLTFPFPSNLGIGNYRSPSRPMNLVPPPFFPGPQIKDGDVKLLRPKQEHNTESYCDSNSFTYGSLKNSNGHSFLKHPTV